MSDPHAAAVVVSRAHLHSHTCTSGMHCHIETDCCDVSVCGMRSRIARVGVQLDHCDTTTRTHTRVLGASNECSQSLNSKLEVKRRHFLRS